MDEEVVSLNASMSTTSWAAEQLARAAERLAAVFHFIGAELQGVLGDFCLAQESMDDEIRAVLELLLAWREVGEFGVIFAGSMLSLGTQARKIAVQVEFERSQRMHEAEKLRDVISGKAAAEAEAAKNQSRWRGWFGRGQGNTQENINERYNQRDMAKACLEQLIRQMEATEKRGRSELVEVVKSVYQRTKPLGEKVSELRSTWRGRSKLEEFASEAGLQNDESRVRSNSAAWVFDSSMYDVKGDSSSQPEGPADSHPGPSKSKGRREEGGSQRLRAGGERQRKAGRRTRKALDQASSREAGQSKPLFDKDGPGSESLEEAGVAGRSQGVWSESGSGSEGIEEPRKDDTDALEAAAEKPAESREEDNVEEEEKSRAAEDQEEPQQKVAASAPAESEAAQATAGASASASEEVAAAAAAAAAAPPSPEAPQRKEVPRERPLAAATAATGATEHSRTLAGLFGDDDASLEEPAEEAQREQLHTKKTKSAAVTEALFGEVGASDGEDDKFEESIKATQQGQQARKAKSLAATRAIFGADSGDENEVPAALRESATAARHASSEPSKKAEEEQRPAQSSHDAECSLAGDVDSQVVATSINKSADSEEASGGKTPLGAEGRGSELPDEKGSDDKQDLGMENSSTSEEAKDAIIDSKPAADGQSKELQEEDEEEKASAGEPQEEPQQEPQEEPIEDILPAAEKAVSEAQQPAEPQKVDLPSSAAAADDAAGRLQNLVESKSTKSAMVEETAKGAPQEQQNRERKNPSRTQLLFGAESCDEDEALAESPTVAAVGVAGTVDTEPSKKAEEEVETRERGPDEGKSHSTDDMASEQVLEPPKQFEDAKETSEAPESAGAPEDTGREWE